MPRAALALFVAALLVGVLTSAAEPTTTATPVLIVIEGPLAPGMADSLARTTSFHGDFGTLAVAEAEPAVVAALVQRGLPVTSLGSWPEGMDLVVTHAGKDAHAEPAPGGRVLFATDRQELIAIPHGADAGLENHCGALVSRAAWTPAAPFAAPAAPIGPAAGSAEGGGAQAAIAVDPRIAAMVAQVSPANLLGTVTQLSSYFTRRADSTTVHQAKTWLIQQATAMGWTVTTHTFSGQYAPNVVATKLGTLHPERLVVLGAHYDSTNKFGDNLQSPGADDNASGSAGLLECARVLGQGSFENTIRCVWFCAEEEGLIGSEAYAAMLDNQDAQVIAMLNMDMIAHLEAGDAYDLDFTTNSSSAPLTQFCRDVTAAYVPGLPTVTGILSAGSSDHASFTAHGFPAAFFFEDLVGYSHYLHTAEDALPQSPNDFGLAADITRACLASAATVAAPVDMTITHAPLPDTGNGGGPFAVQTSVASLTPATVTAVQAQYTVNGGPVQSVALLPSGAPGQWVGSLPGGPALANMNYWLLATDSAGNQQWLPEGSAPGESAFSFLVATVQTVYSQGFEGPGDAGWTHSAPLGGTDDWQRGAPKGKAGDPAAAAQGTSVWGNDLGAGSSDGKYPVNAGVVLSSPSFDCSALSGVHLRFQRWLTVEEGLFDEASVRVNDAVVWQNPVAPGNFIDKAWTPQDLDVSALADGNPAVTVSFNLDADGFFELGGWNVDDVRLVTVTDGAVAPLTISALHLSGAAGGTVHFAIDAGPEHAGRKYILGLSASGTAPGTPLGSVTVPLNIDSLSVLGFNLANTALLPGAAGLLSAQGTAAASFVSPPLPGALAGVHLSFAVFTLGPIDWTSNAVTLEYVP